MRESLPLPGHECSPVILIWCELKSGSFLLHFQRCCRPFSEWPLRNSLFEKQKLSSSPRPPPPAVVFKISPWARGRGGKWEERGRELPVDKRPNPG